MAVNAAQIVEGHYQGSAEVIVECDEADGTDIVVYRYGNGTATLVGTAELGNDTGLGSGKSRVPLTENISIGNQLVAYVEEQWNQGGDPVTVYELSDGLRTGWRGPDVIYLNGDVEISYEEYTQIGGQEIASVYDPQATINNTVNRCGDAPKQFADATLILEKTTADLGAGVVNVEYATTGNFNPALGAARVQWDGGAITQDYQQTYVFADNGAHTVKIYPENLDFETKEFPFTVAVAAGTPAPAVADIRAVAYEINPAANRQVTVLAYSDRQLESRIVGLDDGTHGSGVWVAMSGSTGGKWQQPIPFQNVPNGNYNVDCRVQGTVTVVTVALKVDF